MPELVTSANTALPKVTEILPAVKLYSVPITSSPILLLSTPCAIITPVFVNSLPNIALPLLVIVLPVTIVCFPEL